MSTNANRPRRGSRFRRKRLASADVFPLRRRRTSEAYSPPWHLALGGCRGGDSVVRRGSSEHREKPVVPLTWSYFFNLSFFSRETNAQFTADHFFTPGWIVSHGTTKTRAQGKISAGRQTGRRFRPPSHRSRGQCLHESHLRL